ncbi:hypothetical protein [Escherichia coli]|uniref:hypothetical protein n=1 Tax=Escherichia coli TaxID=562 RepID=UPI000DF1D1BD|nr:hypothetical protein [Escherichia coli]
MMSLWDALRMNMMISYQELVRTFLSRYRTDDFILSKKTAKERLNMQLLRSNNWENYYTSF